MSVYTTIMPWGDKFSIEADLAQAAATIYTIDEEGERHATQWQTADARHDERRAIALALQSCGSDYYAEPGDERNDDEIISSIVNNLEIRNV